MNIVLKFLSLLYIILLANGCVEKDFFEVDLEIKDHRFIPEIIKVPSARPVRITVHNRDDTIEEFESIDLKREKIIYANSSAKIILAALKPGDYKFFGEFHEDTAQGILRAEPSLE